ncbi:hypothetical protein [Neisseria leonii]|uniref:hypothetical protein n=1 Tax=Neisseria leonii TaxID=2995413 RepID=UPI00237BB8E5|nr:hypothetical protein [Neisseria sp. 3986]MDD9324811.1 hypothetical protein [Neisseria sp. 3986]
MNKTGCKVILNNTDNTLTAVAGNGARGRENAPAGTAVLSVPASWRQTARATSSTTALWPDVKSSICPQTTSKTAD